MATTTQILDFITSNPGTTNKDLTGALKPSNPNSMKTTVNRLLKTGKIRSEPIEGTRALKYYAIGSTADSQDKQSVQNHATEDLRMPKNQDNKQPQQTTDFDIAVSTWGVEIRQGNTRILLDNDRLKLLEKFIAAYHTLMASLEKLPSNQAKNLPDKQ